MGEFAQPAGTLSGIAQDAGGAALAGVHLVTDPHGYEATSDADGGFSLSRLPPGTYALVAAADGFETAELGGLVVADGETTDLTVALDPADPAIGRVRVLVLDPAGLPLAGAVVTDSLGGSATTGADGTAYLDDLEGRRVDVSVADAAGTWWGRTVRDLDVPALGSTEVHLQLSGRPAPNAFYVGSTTCGQCHTDRIDAQRASAHGQALASTVTGDLYDRFASGEVVDLGAGYAILGLAGATPTVTVEDITTASRSYAVAGLIGDARLGSVPYTELGDQAYPLPIAWRAERPEPGPWPDTEAAVIPWEVETWLDAQGNFLFAPGEHPAPSRSADARCFACHATGFSLIVRPDGGVDMNPRFGSNPRWTEGAVGCERCHGPGSTHITVSIAEKPYTITRPDRLDADRAGEVCAQCHAMTQGIGNQLPYPWSSDDGLYLPGTVLADHAQSTPDLWPSGAAAEPGGQADELALSAHATGPYRLRCFDCHDPHGEAGDGGEPLPHLLRLDARDNTLCNACHFELTFDGDDDAMRRHDAHLTYEPDGDSQQGRCVRCHMPRSAARLAFSEWTGAGDVISHRFAAISPMWAVDAFEAVRADELPVGHFPTHSCVECHTWNDWRLGDDFDGPVGDPTQKTTHEAYEQAWEAKFP